MSVQLFCNTGVEGLQFFTGGRVQEWGLQATIWPKIWRVQGDPQDSELQNQASMVLCIRNERHNSVRTRRALKLLL